MSRLFARLAIVVTCATMVPACMMAPTSRPASASEIAARDMLAQRASVAVDRLILANALAQRAVAIFRPWLTPERAARVDAAAALVDEAIRRIAAARDFAAQDAAIGDAEARIATYKWLAGA